MSNTEVDLIEVASQERDLRSDIAAAGSDPDREHEDGRPRDGDLDAVQVAERSLGEGWDRAFAYAKEIGNSNKAAAIFADAKFEEFAEGTSPEHEAQLKRVQGERQRLEAEDHGRGN